MNALITESLTQKNLMYVLGFKRELLNSNERTWVEWISDYLLKFGVPPTLDRFEKEFNTSFMPLYSPDPIEDLAAQTLTEKRNLYYRSQVTKTQNEIKDGQDPLPFVKKLYETLQANETGCVTSTTFDRSSYFRTPESLLTGIPGLDNIIGGVVRGDLVYIAGRPGDGKTTLLIYMIAKWYMEGKRVLVISNEIPWEDMLFKVDAQIADMQIAEKRLGKWHPDSERKVRFLQYFHSIAKGNLIIPNRPVRSPSTLIGMIGEHKPDVIAIDGAYLMSPDGSSTTEWSLLAEVSRELKQIANNYHVPIVGILQANRNSEFNNTLTLGSLAGTDAYGQDADTVILLKSAGIVGNDKEVMLYTSKNRNGLVSSTNVRFDFARNRVYEAPAE